MILDAELQFSNAQVLGTGATDSTNLIDLGVDRDIGIGEPMAIVITIGVAADFADADETYHFQLETDDNAAFSSSKIIADQIFITTDARLTLGDKVVLPLGHRNEQFLQLVYTLGGTTPSVTVDAYLQPMSMIDGYTFYANAYDVTSVA